MRKKEKEKGERGGGKGLGGQRSLGTEEGMGWLRFVGSLKL